MDELGTKPIREQIEILKDFETYLQVSGNLFRALGRRKPRPVASPPVHGLLRRIYYGNVITAGESAMVDNISLVRNHIRELEQAERLGQLPTQCAELTEKAKEVLRDWDKEGAEKDVGKKRDRDLDELGRQAEAILSVCKRLKTKDSKDRDEAMSDITLMGDVSARDQGGR
ncbi:hypothetical protein PMZ80_003716 [Knufia obscura]|uniref:Uncharacterized protein n=2 Tax=Knufia TaxID=430999 RepID=A0AAN8ISN3_9EURO|nr:hypothetical protein PMZ80_003716 [Knufia obscura]KAK5958372.1 hypothetical protein OHC33_000214 [Knufia fluminis]